ncbi:Putative transglutaminase-like protein [Mycobacteroides abscessus]|nr:Putative transglutaminase-like protein [Mycobacteroides abscessus]
MRRDIRAQLDVDILEPSTLEFQVAVSPLTGAEVSEELSLELNGRRVEAQEVAGEHGNRIHRLPAERGNLKVSYTATILGQADEMPVEAADLSTSCARAAMPRPTSSSASRQPNSANTPTLLYCWRRCHPGSAPG